MESLNCPVPLAKRLEPVFSLREATGGLRARRSLANGSVMLPLASASRWFTSPQHTITE